MSSLYRHGRFGDCLVEALDDLMRAGKITPDLAFRVLAEFDEVNYLECLRLNLYAEILTAQDGV